MIEYILITIVLYIIIFSAFQCSKVSNLTERIGFLSQRLTKIENITPEMTEYINKFFIDVLERALNEQEEINEELTEKIASIDVDISLIKSILIKERLPRDKERE